MSAPTGRPGSSCSPVTAPINQSGRETANTNTKTSGAMGSLPPWHPRTSHQRSVGVAASRARATRLSLCRSASVVRGRRESGVGRPTANNVGVHAAASGAPRRSAIVMASTTTRISAWRLLPSPPAVLASLRPAGSMALPSERASAGATVLVTPRARLPAFSVCPAHRHLLLGESGPDQLAHQRRPQAPGPGLCTRSQIRNDGNSKERWWLQRAT
jgi:hypothetical protein